MYPVLFHAEQSRSFKGSPRCSSQSSGREESEEESKPETSGVVKRRRCRYACLPCRQRKVRCDGGQPCGLCLKQKRECHYPFKARIAKAQPTQPSIGPAPPVQTPASVTHAMNLLNTMADFDSSPEVDGEPIPLSVAAVGQRFGSKELQFLNTYLKYSYPYLPLVSQDQVRSSLEFDRGALGSLSRAERVTMNANLASTWAVAAIGGCFTDLNSGMQCLHTALEYLRDCFDMPLADSVNAYLAVCEACYRIGLDDASSWMKYVGFADVLEREVSPAAIPPHLRAILSFYHSMLSTTAGGISRGQSTPQGPMVMNREDVDPVVQDIEVMATAHELIGRMVFNPHEDLSQSKQVKVTVMHLTKMAMKLAIDGTKVDSPSNVNYFMSNLFLAYFNIKLRKLREAAFCLVEMVAVQEACPIVLSAPRTVRCPFLMMRVLERLQLWEAISMTQKQVQRLNLIYDGKVDESRVEEGMIMDMLRTLERYAAESTAQVPAQVQLEHPGKGPSVSPPFTASFQLPSGFVAHQDQRAFVQHPRIKREPPTGVSPTPQPGFQVPAGFPVQQEQKYLAHQRPPPATSVSPSTARRTMVRQVSPPSIGDAPPVPQHPQLHQKRPLQEEAPSAETEKQPRKHYLASRGATDGSIAEDTFALTSPDDTFSIQDVIYQDGTDAPPLGDLGDLLFLDPPGGNPDFDTLFGWLS